MRAFSSFHPATLAVYFLAVLMVAMFIWNPILQMIALICGAVFCLLIAKGRGKLSGGLFYVLLFALITLTNPLFSHNGVTPLFFVNGNAVTLEAVCYGGAIGAMVVAVMLWCAALARVMTSDKYLCLIGRFSPKIALLLSMAMGLIPRLKRQAGRISAAGRTLGLYAGESRADALKSRLSVLSVLIGWSAEDGIARGNSMRARGYGRGRRTSYSLFRFKLSDALLLIGSLALLGVILYAAGAGCLAFSYYPELRPPATDGLALAAYLCYGALCALPIIIELEGRFRWRFYRSKI